MSVGRKENNNLVEKAGKAIIDLAFNLFSRHAISNAACSEGMRLRNVTYYNGKLYQLNLDGTRGDEIKMSPTVYRGTFTLPTQQAFSPYTVTHNLGLDTSKAELRILDSRGTGWGSGTGSMIYVSDFSPNSFTISNNGGTTMGTFSYEITYWG